MADSSPLEHAPDSALSSSNQVDAPHLTDTTSHSNGNAAPNGGPAPNPSTALPVQPPAGPDPNAAKVHAVVSSEIGVSTLLQRLKQSVASAKEYSLYLKKRSTLEEEHANGLRKICRLTQENMHRPEHRQGSFVRCYDDTGRIQERMVENGLHFAESLHQMQEDLTEMTARIERGRKNWKQVGLASEQRAVDAESAMRKSKAKYETLADEYDRLRTGERAGGKKFGLKGPKSAAQHEEDLQRKLAAADTDYQNKVQMAQSARAELLAKGRPEAVKALQDLIRECDAGLSLQMQKFAAYNEKLLLSNGMSVSPLKKGPSETGQRSLREVIAAINNEQDLSDFISSFASKVGPTAADIKYEKHPSLGPQSQPMQSQPASFASRTGPASQQPPTFSQQPAPQNYSQPPVPQSYQQPAPQSYPQQPAPQSYNAPPNAGHERSFSTSQPTDAPIVNMASKPPNQNTQPYAPSPISSGPPQLGALSFQSSQPSFTGSPPPAGSPSYPPDGRAVRKPVFGVSLEALFERDGSAVPMVVYQCIQAVDLYGLEVEGIYRLSGTATHITKLKDMFDADASAIDFRNPESFYHDVNSVAGLLKQFFRELPDPLLTKEHYTGFIEAAKLEDETHRRDSLHAIINSLPDPNYATLRALALHLHRVQQTSSVNRMSASNLAIVFGPTLMGANTGPNIQDAGWQVRVIDSVLNNTMQIFDDD